MSAAQAEKLDGISTASGYHFTYTIRDGDDGLSSIEVDLPSAFTDTDFSGVAGYQSGPFSHLQVAPLTAGSITLSTDGVFSAGDIVAIAVGVNT